MLAQIDALNKKINSIVVRQKEKNSSIAEEYNLMPDKVEQMVGEKDDKIYNSLADLVNSRWTMTLQEYQKTGSKCIILHY